MCRALILQQGSALLLVQGSHYSLSPLQNYMGRTPLHMAATLNQTACVRWLLRNGAVVDACDKEG